MLKLFIYFKKYYLCVLDNRIWIRHDDKVAISP